jgi:hypothetical protein
LLDEQYTRTPVYGVRRRTVWLRQQGYTGNPKRVARLLHTMGVETIYPFYVATFVKLFRALFASLVSYTTHSTNERILIAAASEVAVHLA